MRNKPLSVQIWYVLAGTALGILLILLLTLPSILNAFFTKETYGTIASSQQSFLAAERLRSSFDDGAVPERQQELQNIRSVQHLIIVAGGMMLPRNRMPAALADQLLQDVAAQTAGERRYTLSNREGKIYSMATKATVGGREIAVVSYMWDTYQRQLVRTLYKRLIVLMAIITALSWLPSLWLSRYLTRPLVLLQRHVKRIADRDWNEAVRTDRRDEIGQLGESIERMRAQLVRQDETRQSMLQHISHELKTPVMVIHSYAQSIQDGVYPKGDLEGSVRVIETEAERLDRRIHDLLYMTKLDYMAAQTKDGGERKPVRLDLLVQEAANRLRWRNPDIEWRLALSAAAVPADPAQLTVAIENLLDNQLRYARSAIEVALRMKRSAAGDAAELRLANDGPPIEEEAAARLFQPFQKGMQGNFGLGLSIVQRILALHGGRVRAVNEPPGAAFYVELPAGDLKPR